MFIMLCLSRLASTCHSHKAIADEREIRRELEAKLAELEKTSAAAVQTNQANYAVGTQAVEMYQVEAESCERFKVEYHAEQEIAWAYKNANEKEVEKFFITHAFLIHTLRCPIHEDLTH